MKKTLSLLILGALPVMAMASGSHSSGHDSHGAPAMEARHDAHDHESNEAKAGRAGNPDQVNRTIAVTMDDNMRFSPSDLRFRAGETVRFKVVNNGRIRHEMVIGSVDELQEHAQMMRGNPNMQHDDANMISLAPGESTELVWQFGQSGDFDFACLVPGHLEAGMTGKIRVQ